MTRKISAAEKKRIEAINKFNADPRVIELKTRGINIEYGRGWPTAADWKLAEVRKKQTGEENMIRAQKMEEVRQQITGKNAEERFQKFVNNPDVKFLHERGFDIAYQPGFQQKAQARAWEIRNKGLEKYAQKNIEDATPAEKMKKELNVDINILGNTAKMFEQVEKEMKIAEERKRQADEELLTETFNELANMASGYEEIEEELETIIERTKTLNKKRIDSDLAKQAEIEASEALAKIEELKEKQQQDEIVEEVIADLNDNPEEWAINLNELNQYGREKLLPHMKELFENKLKKQSSNKNFVVNFKVGNTWRTLPLWVVYNKLLHSLDLSFSAIKREHIPEIGSDTVEYDLVEWDLIDEIELHRSSYKKGPPKTKAINKTANAIERDLTLSALSKYAESINSSKDASGGFFPYIINENVPEIIEKQLARYQIFKSITASKDEFNDCCFVYALKMLNIDENILNKIRLRLTARYQSATKIHEVCDEFKINCVVHYMDSGSEERSRKIRKTVKGQVRNYLGCCPRDAKYAVELCLYEGHYFLYEKTGFTRYYLENIETTENPLSFYDGNQMRIAKDSHESANIYSDVLVKYLIDTNQFSTLSYEELVCASDIEKLHKNAIDKIDDLSYDPKYCCKLIKTDRKKAPSEKHVWYADFECDTGVRTKRINGEKLAEFEKKLTELPRNSVKEYRNLIRNIAKLKDAKDDILNEAIKNNEEHKQSLEKTLKLRKKKKRTSADKDALLVEWKTRKVIEEIIDLECKKNNEIYKDLFDALVDAEELLENNEYNKIKNTINKLCNGNQHLPYLCVAQNSTGSVTKVFIGGDCAKEFLNFIPDKSLVFFHNLSYDFRMLAKYGVCSSVERNSQTLSAMIKYKEKTINLQDSYALISDKLSEFPKMFELGEIQKEKFPYNYYTINHHTDSGIISEAGKYEVIPWDDNDYAEFEANIDKIEGCRLGKNEFDMEKYAVFYCLQDVRILREGMNKFRNNFEVFDIDSTNYLSASSLAEEVFKDSVYSKCGNIYKVGGIVRNFMQQAVYGGRCMTALNKKYHVLGRLFDYDAVSLYPSAMEQLYILKGMPKVLNIDRNIVHSEVPKQLKDYDGYVVEILITEVGKRRQFPLIVKRDKKGNNLNDDFIPEEGVKMVVDQITLEDLFDFQKIKCKIIKGYYYNEGKDYTIQKVIKDIFAKRAMYKKKGNPLEVIYKLIMNSAYGKTIQKAIEKDVKYIKSGAARSKYWLKNYNKIIEDVSIEGSDYHAIKTRKSVDKHFCFSILGINILSMSKRIMNQVMCLAEDNNIKIFYQDTDSMHIEVEGVEKLKKLFEETYGKKLEGTDMGQFHPDFRSNTGRKDVECSIESIFLGKKMYIDKLLMKNGDIEYMFRMKGVKQVNITQMARKCFDGDIFAVYKYLFDRIPSKKELTKKEKEALEIEHLIYGPHPDNSITFDLCDGSPCFEMGQNLIVKSLSEFKRVIKTDLETGSL